MALNTILFENIKITFLSIVSHFLKNSYTKVVKLMYEIAKYNCVYVDEKVSNNITDVQNPQGLLAVIEKKKAEADKKYAELSKKISAAERSITPRTSVSLLTSKRKQITLITKRFCLLPLLITCSCQVRHFGQ